MTQQGMSPAEAIAEMNDGAVRNRYPVADPTTLTRIDWLQRGWPGEGPSGAALDAEIESCRADLAEYPYNHEVRAKLAEYLTVRDRQAGNTTSTATGHYLDLMRAFQRDEVAYNGRENWVAAKIIAELESGR
jgi:hypothetical protein